MKAVCCLEVSEELLPGAGRLECLLRQDLRAGSSCLLLSEEGTMVVLKVGRSTGRASGHSRLLLPSRSHVVDT